MNHTRIILNLIGRYSAGYVPFFLISRHLSSSLNQYLFIMDKIISNQWDAYMSVQAINDMINVRICMNALNRECMSLSEPMALAYCARIHRIMLGWS